MLTMQSRAYSRTALPLTGTAQIILTKKVVAGVVSPASGIARAAFRMAHGVFEASRLVAIPGE
jgi:hypothetical protein